MSDGAKILVGALGVIATLATILAVVMSLRVT